MLLNKLPPGVCWRGGGGGGGGGQQASVCISGVDLHVYLGQIAFNYIEGGIIIWQGYSLYEGARPEATI